MGKVIAICRSEKKGTQKQPIESGEFRKDWGLENDAHAGNWHRQVSLISQERIIEFQEKGAKVGPGAFGENLIVEGIDFRELPVGTLLRCNQVLLELTQIGKECHTHCAIYHSVGDCIMPREGVFAKVLESGTIHLLDEMVIETRAEKRPYQAAVITLSDKGSKKEREDLSGPLICKTLKEKGYEVVEAILLPDDQKQLEKELIRLSDQRQLDLILTTGGTGFSARDITPEATSQIATRIAPGIAEAIRMESMKQTKRAMLSRGVSVIRNKTLIINLPGSPKACQETMDVFLQVIDHGLDILRQETGDCAR